MHPVLETDYFVTRLYVFSINNEYVHKYMKIVFNFHLKNIFYINIKMHILKILNMLDIFYKVTWESY